MLVFLVLINPFPALGEIPHNHSVALTPATTAWGRPQLNTLEAEAHRLALADENQVSVATANGLLGPPPRQHPGLPHDEDAQAQQALSALEDRLLPVAAALAIANLAHPACTAAVRDRCVYVSGQLQIQAERRSRQGLGF